MWEKFTSSAKRIIKYAHEEAKAAQSDSVGSEHILLGIIFDRRSIACKLLKSMNVDLDELDTKIRENLTYGNYKFDNLDFDANAKRILELAYKEARDVRHTFIGSAHMLLAILKLPDTKACQILNSVGVDYEGYSKKFLEKLAEDEKKADEPESIQAYSAKSRQKTPVHPEREQTTTGRDFLSLLLWTGISTEAEAVLRLALEDAAKRPDKRLTPEDLLFAILKLEPLEITAFLNKYGVTYDQAIEYFKDTKKEDLPEKKPDDDTKGLAEDEKT